MQKEILINNIKFWVSQNIIYCKLYDDSDVNCSNYDVEDIFYEAISILSDGNYLPIIFNFREINYSFSVKLFKFLSKNSKIKSSVLSEAFVVKNNRQKLLLYFSVLFSNSRKHSSVYKDSDLAIKYSNKSYTVFNSISGKVVNC